MMDQKETATRNLQANTQPFSLQERAKKRYDLKKSLLLVVVAILLLNSTLSGWNAHSNRRNQRDIAETRAGSGSGCAGTNHADEGEFDWSTLTPSETLQWVPCYKDFQCTRLSVPLDYSEPSGEKAAIALTKWPAKVPLASKEYRGPVLFNPGGPGGSGVATILRIAKDMEKVLGSDYDLIGFDPRGVGYTTPQFSPFTGEPAAAAWALQQIKDANSSANGVGLLHAQAQVSGDIALDNARKAGQHMSTAVVARDMLSITRAHGREKLLYWGFSYGTVLGATYAAMFPDNVERVIIDGVVDVENYYSALWSNNLNDTDAELEFMYELCVKAGPDACSLHENSTSLIAERVNKLIHKLDLSPVGFRNNQTGDYGVIRGSDVKIAIFRTLYSIYVNSKRLVNAIVALEEGDPQPLFELDFSGAISNRKALECSCPASSLMRSAGRNDKALEAIACGEGDIIIRDSEELETYYREMAKTSQFSYLWLIHGSCSGWKIRAKEIFNGPFVGNTSHPLLLIGNKLDPVTPVWDAHKLAKGFKDSVVLTQNSAGHCSTAAVSLCTTKYVRAYFRDGTLPSVGTVCEVESELFGGDSSSFAPGIVNTLAADEVDLLNAAANLQEADFVIKHV